MKGASPRVSRGRAGEFQESSHGTDSAGRTRRHNSGREVTLGTKLDGLIKGTRLALGLRPEALHLGGAEKREVSLPAHIEEVHFMGSVIRLRADVGGSKLALDMFNRHDMPPPEAGAVTDVRFKPEHAIVLAS
jgi:putative spermidine/putrescine transport system ATP-binding protein